MKLLIYTPVFAPNVGGIETIVLTLTRGLTDLVTCEGVAEFDVKLITQTAAGKFKDEELPFQIVRRPSLKQLWSAIRASDVVHIACPAVVPLVLSLLARKPVVVEHHGFQTICPTGQLLMEPDGIPCPGHFMAGRHLKCMGCRSTKDWKHSYMLWLSTFFRRFLCRHVAANIMPTEWLLGTLNLKNAITIPHGIEMPSPVISTRHASGPPLIVFQGRLVTTKGLDVLLRALAILHAEHCPFELVVIGDGPERASLVNLTHSLQISDSVRFAGRLAAVEMESTLADARIVAMPSLAGEVFGLVLAENMSRGLAVVVSDIGALVEVAGNAGLTFHKGDSQDLAQKLRELLSDPELATRLGKLARQRMFDVYSPNGMVNKHADVYRSLIR